MDETTRLGDDLHLLAAPFRFVFGIVKAAIFLVILSLVLLGLCVHAAMVGGPVMDDDMWFLTKVLFCVLAPFVAALIAGMLSKSSLGVVWAKEFIVLVLCFTAVVGLIRSGVVTFNDDDHAPAIWMNPHYDYSDVYKGGSAFRIGSRENGKFELSSEEVEHLRSDCFKYQGTTERGFACAKRFDCLKNSATSDDWKAANCH